MSEFRRRVLLPASAEAVFAWHGRPGAFERLKPPWERVEVVSRSGSIRDGDRIVVKMGLGPFRLRWVAEHRDYLERRQFRDVQIKGPFARWVHTHRVEPVGPDACHLDDHIEYTLPVAPLSEPLVDVLVQKKLARLFAYRHRVVAEDMKILGKGGATMKILVPGSTGLIGSNLLALLRSGGHEVVPLVRRKRGGANEELYWDPYAGVLDAGRLEGFDAVVHLSGENVAGRWTDEKKQKILESRLKTTRLLSDALAGLNTPPKVFVCASAIGYYGDRGDEVLTEESAAGEGFLADVVKRWEAATEPAAEQGVRVVNTRFGVVLSPEGGALAKMLLPFKLGLGGFIGSGDQWWSWVAMDDVVGAIHHALTTEDLRGPVNIVAPNPTTNRQFTRVLGRVLARPTLFPVPSFAARLAFGEMADEMLLASARVEPRKLKASGYEFRFTDLEEALRHLLGKKA